MRSLNATLWKKAPFALRRHPVVAVAVVVSTGLSALVASSSPLLRLGVQSDALRGQVRFMSPFAAGLEVRTAGPVREDARRQAAARELAEQLPGAPSVVLTTLHPAELAGGRRAGTVSVVAVSRTAAVAHVHVLSRVGGAGVYVAATVARQLGVRAGDVVRFTAPGPPGGRPPAILRVRVAGVYQPLADDADNPYWANFIQDIRTVNADAAPLPTFVLMPHRLVLRLGTLLDSVVEDRFEYPASSSSITFTGARRLLASFDEVTGTLAAPTPLARGLGCRAGSSDPPASCRTTSGLRAALAASAANVAAVGPTISVLADVGLAVALLLAAGTGVFVVRRRADEVAALHARGDAAARFAGRLVVEAAVLAVFGWVVGYGAALLALWLAAPPGTVVSSTLDTGVRASSIAVLVAVGSIAFGAFCAFPRARPGGLRAWTALRLLPWEAVALPLAAVAVLVVKQRSGTTAAHPALVAFAAPLLAAAGVGGLAMRGIAEACGRARPSRSAGRLLVQRRLGATSGLLALVTVAGAVGFSAFAFATTMADSLERSVQEKAFIANGSDVQGFIEPSFTLSARLPFPAAIVQVDSQNVFLDDGQPVDLVSGVPRDLMRTIRWGTGWPDDPRPLLPRLTSRAGELAALQTPGGPRISSISDQGVRIPVHVVGRAAVPAMTSVRPALLVSSAALERILRRSHRFFPGPGSTGLVWARGEPRRIEPQLASSGLYPTYLTTTAHIRDDGSVTAAQRSYRYFNVIGIAAGALSLLGLLLHLQARQRTQRVASGFLRRMGFTRLGDVSVVVIESAMLAVAACAAATAAAVVTASSLVGRLDPLGRFAPQPSLVVPWRLIGGAAAIAVAAACIAGVVAGLVAGRGEIGEALRLD